MGLRRNVAESLQRIAQCFRAVWVRMSSPAKPSVCICDMVGQTAVLTAGIPPEPLQNVHKIPGLRVRQHYAMHTGMVRVDISRLQTWEYIRDIKEENVQKLFDNILVRATEHMHRHPRHRRLMIMRKARQCSMTRR